MLPPARAYRLALTLSLSACAPTHFTNAPARAPGEDALKFGAATFGTPHPFLLQSWSHRWGWVAACQPREDTDGDGRIELSMGLHGETLGDEPQAFFFAKPGDGERIDRFLSRDESGRFAAYVQDGRRLVYDASSGKVLDLELVIGASVHEDAKSDPLLSEVARRSVALSRDGRAFVARRGPGGTEIVSVDITSGSQVTLHTTRFPLWSLQLADDERSLLISEVTSDTDRNGVLELPNVLTNLSSIACRGLATSFSRFVNGGDRPIERALPRVGRAPQPPQDVEEFEGVRDCSRDGRRPMLRIKGGPVLLSSGAPRILFEPHFGPVEWVSGQLVECARKVELPDCDDDQPSSTFCDLSQGKAFGMQVFGFSKEHVFYAGDELLHVEAADFVDGQGSGFVALHGAAQDDVWALESGRMVHYDGDTWRQTRDPIFEPLRGVFGVRRDRAWAFGKSGALLRFDGTAWRRATSPSRESLVSLWASPSDRVWVGTNRNELFTGDGKRWTSEALPEEANALDFWGDEGHLFAITSAGTLWQRLKHWERVGALVAPHAIYSNQLRDIHGTSARDLWVSTADGRLIHFDGANFSTFDSRTHRNFERIVAVDERDIYVLGGWSILRFRR